MGDGLAVAVQQTCSVAPVAAAAVGASPSGTQLAQALLS
jgi:hypothetical protein